jgi:hypothetical protein
MLDEKLQSGSGDKAKVIRFGDQPILPPYIAEMLESSAQIPRAYSADEVTKIIEYYDVLRTHLSLADQRKSDGTLKDFAYEVNLLIKRIDDLCENYSHGVRLSSRQLDSVFSEPIRGAREAYSL